ncbi:Methyltransferase type 12 [Candidatus Koribacter versatilis Ellin345]|uniref:Methyltransferase type 12 n=1 Tax=Koribacter versatilis (strain Ellin345) TaxID=204669 RepID=Q1IHZ6_KORVE|nr:class I SAM-dependent methyltransferase [Candidatus Koribacter versatilis]ABF43504.1 Methyltransferase type 12 [Candidatus Koribacter versatilis Ellin345]
MTSPDKSNGYEQIAARYIAGRGTDPDETGAVEVAEWGRTLPSGATVLDLACGTGVPISLALMNCGLNVYGVDASPSMVAAFRERFPGVPVQCSAVEESDFFGKKFDGVVAWGLMFLLEPETQYRLIAKVGAHLVSGGKFVFTAPWQTCMWKDLMTQRISISLGQEAYIDAIENAGMRVVGHNTDGGQNYYYLCEKDRG